MNTRVDRIAGRQAHLGGFVAFPSPFPEAYEDEDNNGDSNGDDDDEDKSASSSSDDKITA